MDEKMIDQTQLAEDLSSKIKYIDVEYTLPNGQKVKIQSC